MTALLKKLQPDPEEILNFLELPNLPDEDKEKLLTGIMDHFTEIISETMIQSLTVEQSAQLSAVLDLSSPEREERISDIVSAVPGLHNKLEQAVMDELAIIKNAYKQV